MGKINWGRVFLCGLLTTVVWLIWVAISMHFLGRDFLAAAQALGGSDPTTRPGAAVLLVLLNLLAGIWTMWLYAAIRPRYGPGPKTAAIAGFAMWLVCSAADGIWCLLVPIPPSALVGPIAAALPAMVLAAVVGAWPYKE